MRTPLLVGIVVAAHCVAVGSVVLIQGCGTTMPPPDTGMVTQGPIVPPEPVEPTPPASEPKQTTWTPPKVTSSYVVAPGDTLSGIAKKFGLSVPEICALNGIQNPDLIYEGQKLMLPGNTEAPKPAAHTERPRLTPPPGAKVHIVKTGDTLSEIAVEYGVSMEAIRRANNLAGDKILVDQELIIPGDNTPTPSFGRRDTGVGIDLNAAPVTEEPEELAPVEAPDEAIMEEPEVITPEAPAPTSGYLGTEEPVATYRIHTVEEGEDLYSVAMLWGVSVATLKELNKLEGTALKPGQTLKIPVSE